MVDRLGGDPAELDPGQLLRRPVPVEDELGGQAEVSDPGQQGQERLAVPADLAEIAAGDDRLAGVDQVLGELAGDGLARLLDLEGGQVLIRHHLFQRHAVGEVLEDQAAGVASGAVFVLGHVRPPAANRLPRAAGEGLFDAKSPRRPRRR